MSFWNDPGASLQGFMHNPWQSTQNFFTSGVVPTIPYIAGTVGGAFGGPAGAAGAGSTAQMGIDYFSGNSEARTGKGMQDSAKKGAAKGSLGNAGFNFFSNGGLTGGQDGSFGMEELQSPFIKKLAESVMPGQSQDQQSQQPNQTQQMQQQQSLSARADQLRSHIAMLKSQRASMGGVLSTPQV